MADTRQGTAAPVLVTLRVNVTFVLGEPNAGTAVLATSMFASLAKNGGAIGSHILAVFRTRRDLDQVGESHVAGYWAVEPGHDLKISALADSDGPMSAQSTFCPWLTAAGEEET